MKMLKDMTKEELENELQTAKDDLENELKGP